MVETFINDSNYYKQLNGDPYEETLQEYAKFLKKYTNGLIEKELDYLENFEVKTS